MLAEGVALHDDFAVVQDRRTGEAPLHGWGVVGAGVKFAEVFAPKFLTFHVETEEAFGTKHGDHSPAVGRGRGIAMRRLGVAFETRDGFKGEFVPKNFAGE